MVKTSSIIFLLLYMLCCNSGLERASCTNETKVLEVLFVHTYCAQENLSSQVVFDDVNATMLSLNSTLRDADGTNWELHFSEGDKLVSLCQLECITVVLTVPSWAILNVKVS